MNLYVVLVGASLQPQAEALYGETGTRKLRGERRRREGGEGRVLKDSSIQRARRLGR